jgi:hypothetical protein
VAALRCLLSAEHRCAPRVRLCVIALLRMRAAR